MSEHDGGRAGAENDPFFLSGGPVGCLLIHGFTATPWEMRFLGERLHAAGYTVSGVRLAGHGTSPDDLARATWRDWYASARDALQTLHTHTPHVIVVGQSMGALLALELAADTHAGVAGLALLSPALLLTQRWLPWVAPVIPALRPFLGQRCFNKGESDIADAAARAASPNARRVPLRALCELLQLQRRVHRRLGAVRQPVLVIHSRQDHACPLDNVAVLENHLRGRVQAILLQDSYHVISVDVDKERVATEVAKFVAGCATSVVDRRS